MMRHRSRSLLVALIISCGMLAGPAVANGPPPPPVFDCIVSVLNIPAGVEQGDPILVEWAAFSTGTITATWVEYRRSTTPTWTQLASQAGPGPFTVTIPTTGFAAGDSVLVRAREESTPGNCESATHTVTITAGQETCVAEILSAPASVAQGGDVLVQWRGQSNRTIPHMNLHYSINGGGELPGPVYTGGAGLHTFTDTISTAGLAVGASIAIRAHVRTSDNTNCYSGYAYVSVAAPAAPCEVTILSYPTQVEQGQDIVVTYRIQTTRASNHAHLHYRLSNQVNETPLLPLHSVTPGTTQFTDAIPTSGFAVGSIVVFRGHVAVTNPVTNCYSANRTCLITQPGASSCSTSITQIPTSVEQGADIPVDWEVTSNSAGTSTVIWRPTGSWWRPGPSVSLPGPVVGAPYSGAVDIGTPTVGRVIEVKSRITNGTGKCYSDSSFVTVTGPAAECETEITSIPGAVEQGNPVPVTFEATSNSDGWAAILWRVQGSYWRDGGTTRFTGPIVDRSFSASVDVGAPAAGTVLEFMSRVINATTRCYSAVSPVTIAQPGVSCAVDVTSAPASVDQGDPIPVQWQATSNSPGWTAILWRPQGSWWRDGGTFRFNNPIISEAFSASVNVGTPGVGAVIELRARVINASETCYSDIEETTITAVGGSGAGAQSAGDGAAGLGIVSASAGAEGVSVVVQVTAAPGAASTVWVEWSADGQIARTAEQSGTGSYRAVFALPAAAKQAQARGVIDGVSVRSEAKAVGGA